jgi:hypothetical protein
MRNAEGRFQNVEAAVVVEREVCRDCPVVSTVRSNYIVEIEAEADDW